MLFFIDFLCSENSMSLVQFSKRGQYVSNSSNSIFSMWWRACDSVFSWERTALTLSDEEPFQAKPFFEYFPPPQESFVYMMSNLRPRVVAKITFNFTLLKLGGSLTDILCSPKTVLLTFQHLMVMQCLWVCDGLNPKWAWWAPSWHFEMAVGSNFPSFSSCCCLLPPDSMEAS